MSWLVKANLEYTQTHEWLRREDEALVTMGITDFAQDNLGDIVFVELPQVGMEVKTGESIVTIESVKAVTDSYAPVDGTVAAVNHELEQQPDLLNRDPYNQGWIVQLELKDGADDTALINKEAYEDFIHKGEGGSP